MFAAPLGLRDAAGVALYVAEGVPAVEVVAQFGQIVGTVVPDLPTGRERAISAIGMVEKKSSIACRYSATPERVGASSRSRAWSSRALMRTT